MDALQSLEQDILNDEILVHEFENIDEAQELFDNAISLPELLDDDKAFNVVIGAMDYMKNSGEFERVQQMAMTIGAMACNHEHLQAQSEGISDRFSDILSTNTLKKHDHDHSDSSLHKHDDDDDEYNVFGKKKSKKSKSKKKTVNYFSFFGNK